MRLLHTAVKTHARFDDPNLVSHAGLVPAVRLAQNIGLEDLARRHVRVAAKVGANPQLKIGALVAGMVAGADTIDGMDLLRHGAFPATVGGIRAPSTLGSFLRAFDHGNVRQLAAVHRRVLVELAARAPLLPGADAVAFVDVDSVQRRVYGGTKQGAAFGHAKIASKSLLVRGLNVLAATVSTPLAAPVVAAARLRGGNAGSARGAATLVAEAITTARQAGATGLIVVRADSAYYAGALVAACRRNRARFSVTVRMDPRADGSQGAPGDRHHPRPRLDRDQIPERDLRRAGRRVDLRRGDRQGALHRVRLETGPPHRLSRSSLVARSAPLLLHDVAVSSEPNPGSEPDPDR